MTLLLDHSGRAIPAEEIEAIRQAASMERYPQQARVATRYRSTAGTYIDPDTSLTISAAWACVRFLAQTVGMLPWRVKLKSRRGNEVQENHPVDYLLNDRPCPEATSQEFRERLTSWALRWGNGYAEIERGVDGRPLALWPIHPSRVTVYRDVDTLELYYEVANDSLGGRLVQFQASDVFHLRGLGEGPVGLSVMAYAAQSLGWVKAAQLFGATFFGQGASLAGVVTMKKKLSPAALEELRKDFDKLYAGAQRGGRTAFLDNEMAYQSIGIDPEKGQFVETNQFLLDEVCRWFGVPPHKIYNLLRATFSNIEHQSIEVVTDSIMPWAKRFEAEADYKLFGQNRRGLFTDIELKELLRGDTKSRLEYYTGLRNIGAMNANEIRAAEGENSIGPQGDKYTIQSGFTTLDKVGEDPKPAAPSAPRQAPEQNPPPPPPRAEDRATNERAVLIGAALAQIQRNDEARRQRKESYYAAAA